MCNSFQNRNYLPLVWNRECHCTWTGPLLLPCVSPDECCWFSCLHCSWTGRIVNSAEKGWWVRPMIKCRKTSCVCKVIWAQELENPSDPLCCWFEETCVMKVFLGHYSDLFVRGCWHVWKRCIYFRFNVLLFCILPQNNTFPCEPELQLEPEYEVARYLICYLRNLPHSEQLEIIFPISTHSFSGSPGHILWRFSLLLSLLWDQMTSGSIAFWAFG